MNIIFFILFALPLSAKILITPLDAMKDAYPTSTDVVKKNIILSKKNASTITSEANVKLPSKIFRVFRAYENEKVIAYGILLNKKVRSKNAAVLYIISQDSILKNIEIIAFNEPAEYLPSKTWNAQFENISTDTKLRSSKEIANITGATLSAKSITDGSRIAFAFYNNILKGKE